MVFRSTGLKRPRLDPAVAERIPPGQYVSERWPAYHAGFVPAFDPATWDLRVSGDVERPLRFTWDEFQQAPTVSVSADMHCVTRWSKLGLELEGVPFRHIIELAKPTLAARHVLFVCDGDYSANVPLEVAAEEDVILALRHDGEPLTPEHGFPVRVVIPSRYAWKSAKWLRGIEFLTEDRLGFWERYGYHNNGEVWKEERFADE